MGTLAPHQYFIMVTKKLEYSSLSKIFKISKTQMVEVGHTSGNLALAICWFVL